ncbi:MAG: hypothetical protein IIX75_00515, partial [Clostridia bacterium]|nr:hypothetical protein [Clostridia bacterium]
MKTLFEERSLWFCVSKMHTTVCKRNCQAAQSVVFCPQSPFKKLFEKSFLKIFKNFAEKEYY